MATYLLESRWTMGALVTTEYATVTVPPNDDWIARALATRDRIIYPQMREIAAAQMLDLLIPPARIWFDLVRLSRVEGGIRLEERGSGFLLLPTRLTPVCTFSFDEKTQRQGVHPV